MVSVVKTVKNTDRLRQIATILAKHGFGELLGRISLRALIPGVKPADPASRTSFAARLRQAAQELGPSFVKLGQIASTRTDLLPADVIAELKKLQDDVAPMTADEVDEILAESFAGTADELFAEIDRTPLASASIGQVHRARLRVAGSRDGDAPREVDVVIKLQRPRIRHTIERDLDLLHTLARLVEKHMPESRIYSPVGLVEEFDRAIMAELDFTLEADNAERFARNFSGDGTVRFPHIYRHASGKRVLTMERFHGEKIYDMAAAGGGEVIARNALHVIARMIFEHGFFHADPHPGNIIMLGSASDPVIGLIDLGLVGRLSPDMRDKAIDLMLAAITGDADSLASALLAMGRPRGRVDMEAFRGEVRTLSEKYLGRPIAEIELAALIRDLVQGAIKYEIDMPVELMMVGKSLMTVEVIGKEIHPELDIWAELRPYFVALLRQRYSPERIGRDLLRTAGQLRAGARELPGQISDILADARAGRLHVRTTDDAVALAGDRLGRRIFAAVCAGSLLACGTALLIAGRYTTLGGVFLALAATLIVLHWVGDYRRH